MTNDFQLAKELLDSTDCTCVICKASHTVSSVKHGVKPLLEWLGEGGDWSGASAADRVVGNGAAYLYVLLGVNAVYARVISHPALETLRAYGIATEYAELVPYIHNRSDTGICPIEAAVSDALDPADALRKIRKRLSELV